MRNLEDLLLPDDGGLARPTPQPPQPVPVEHSEAMDVAEDGVEAAQAPQKVEVPVSNLFDETSEAEEAEDDEEGGHPEERDHFAQALTAGGHGADLDIEQMLAAPRLVEPAVAMNGG